MPNAPTPKPIQAVLFDKDGTLLDFNSTFGPATRQVVETLAAENGVTPDHLARPLGFGLSDGTFEADSVLIAGSLANIAQVCAPVLGVPMSKALVQRIDHLYRKATESTLTAFDGTSETLSALRFWGLPLGIATNDTEETACLHMAQLGLGGHFAKIIGSDSGYGEKPEPGMIEAFAKACTLPCRSIAMVGDSDRDLLAAKAAGAIAIAVTSGHASREQLAPLADHVISGIAELPRLIARLNRS